MAKTETDPPDLQATTMTADNKPDSHGKHPDTTHTTVITEHIDWLVERPALAVRLDLRFRSVYFLSGNIFRTAEPISTKVCTVTATG